MKPPKPISRPAPTLSLCMIVKNEAANLERCLANARPYVDEIVVVDTGSTDGTQAIAQRYADVFDEIEWPDSFAVARNYSFDKATGTYILILDGDEYIEDEESWRQIRFGITQKKVAGIQLHVRNVLPETQILAADCHWQDRIVRNHPDLRYEGSVHNQIRPSIERFVQRTGQRVLRVPAEVVHVGYALPQAQRDAKYEARLHLLQREVEDAPDAEIRAYYQYQLGNAFSMMARFQEAATVLNEVEYEALAPENAYYTHLLAAYANLKTHQPQLAMLHADSLLGISRQEPVGYYVTGLILLALDHPGDALHMLIGAYEANNDNEGQVRFPIHEAQLFRLIGAICAQKGLLERAHFFLSEYLKHQPDDPEIVAVLPRIEASLNKQRVARAGSAT